MKIGIIDYGLGNLGSVCSAFRFFKSDVILIDNSKGLDNVDVIVLAGVGNFNTAIRKLKERAFCDELNNQVLKKGKLTIGICLGMQLFADVSYEDGKNKGFGWIEGKVVLMEGKSLRVPHIGWDKVEPKESILFKGMQDNYFYFMHSYHFIPEDKRAVIGTTKCGDLEIVSAVRKENIIGCQFHPEKSQAEGLKFIKNILGCVKC